MIWTYCILKHTLTHALCTHQHAYNSRAHTRVWHCVFFLQYACHTHAAIHKSIQTHCTNRCARKRPRAPSWTLSFSHSHAHALPVTHYYMSILWTSLPQTSPYTFSPLAVFGRQTMTNDSKWKCTTCSPIRPLSSKPNICVFLSVCTRLVVRSAEKGKKRLQPMKNVREWLKAPSLVL